MVFSRTKGLKDHFGVDQIIVVKVNVGRSASTRSIPYFIARYKKAMYGSSGRYGGLLSRYSGIKRSIRCSIVEDDVGYSATKYRYGVQLSRIGGSLRGLS